ncbi:MAG: response regulator [Pegethrix bostrychoides GSE-TBD4-15B]|uniref:Response regulator n=1 Tax=Pegethrix bostrychoides GSE-TBD4-15B TaxID=2839662 RepID=A0A951U4W7_9CYAN|nr:response regulator [Pegethrix bostrychoides GSE-TBD4-15B]
MTQRLVLVIEDDEPVREIICSCFEDIAGWQVAAASSGQAGLELAESICPDAIVLDLMMPAMDGLMFLQHLRASATRSATDQAVVLLTAKVDLIPSRDLTALGVKGLIAKPFDPMLLTHQVAQLLGWD